MTYNELTRPHFRAVGREGRGKVLDGGVGSKVRTVTSWVEQGGDPLGFNGTEHIPTHSI